MTPEQRERLTMRLEAAALAQEKRMTAIGEALADYFDFYGTEHEDDCPEDDPANSVATLRAQLADVTMERDKALAERNEARARPYVLHALSHAGRSGVQGLEEALSVAINAINRDRSGLGAALGQIIERARDAWWITEGRGSYEWNDDRYREEAGVALRKMVEIAGDALKASGNLADVEFRKAREVLGRMP